MMLSQVNKNVKIEDVVLIDENPTSKKLYDWQGYKFKSLDVSDSFKRISFDKSDERFLKRADRVAGCCNFLEFKRYFKNNERRLHRAYFCKDRLCPACMIRRSKKIYGQVSQVMDVAVKEYEFIFLTLTLKNCMSDELSSTLDLMFSAWTKLFRRTRIKKTIKGWFRALEVTHNVDKNSSFFDTYHPHFHIILAVKKSYFKSPDYIKHSEFVDLWKECLGVDYTPVVDIRRFKSSDKNRAKSIAEVAKYTVKDNDYLIRDKYDNVIEDITDSSIYVLALALKNRRLVAFGGCLKKIHQSLKLDDAENGDLIMTDNDSDVLDLEYLVETFRWGVGYRNAEFNYYLFDSSLPEKLRRK